MNDCRGQLLQRIRRGLASDQERTAFEAHLGTCEMCRLALDIGDDFDQVGGADSEDAERVARIAAIARQVRSQLPPAITPLRSSRLVWPLAAAALVLTGAAVAGGVGWQYLRADSAEAPSPPTPQQPATVAPPPAAQPERIRVSEPTESAEPPPRPATRAAPAEPQALAPPPTAAELYRLANEARRSGQTSQAIAQYQQLQQRFPGSAQARLSHVSLGRLLLHGGSAAGALAQFDAYLAGGSGQRLAAEALFGRGRALQALGRQAEEVQNWRRLIGQYPDSAYATHASRRLEQFESH
jgi:TolA-binding protein